MTTHQLKEIRDKLRSLETDATFHYGDRLRAGASEEELRQINASCERMNAAAQIIEKLMWK